MAELKTGLFLPADPEKKPSIVKYNADVYHKFRETIDEYFGESVYLESKVCNSTITKSDKFRLPMRNGFYMAMFDEDGLIKKLPVNPHTKELAPYPIVGDVLLVVIAGRSLLQEYHSLRGIFTDEDAQEFLDSLEYRGADRK